MILTKFCSDFLYKSICCWYSFELPQLVEAIQMSTNNIPFCKEVDKSTLVVISLKTTKSLDCVLIGICVVIRLNTIVVFLAIMLLYCINSGYFVKSTHLTALH